MLDGAVNGNVFQLTTWDRFERGLVRWSNMVVSDSFGCWNLQHTERSIPTFSLEDTQVLGDRLGKNVGSGRLGASHWRAGAQT